MELDLERVHNKVFEAIKENNIDQLRNSIHILINLFNRVSQKNTISIVNDYIPADIAEIISHHIYVDDDHDNDDHDYWDAYFYIFSPFLNIDANDLLRNKQFEIIRLLIEYDLDQSIENVWIEEVNTHEKFNNFTILENILKCGFDINYYDTYDCEGNTALHIASKRNNVELVDFLLQKGADQYNINEDGHTAMSIAHEYECDDVIRYFNSRLQDEEEDNETLV